jgi:hypothetical protein
MVNIEARMFTMTRPLRNRRLRGWFGGKGPRGGRRTGDILNAYLKINPEATGQAAVYLARSADGARFL